MTEFYQNVYNFLPRRVYKLNLYKFSFIYKQKYAYF